MGRKTTVEKIKKLCAVCNKEFSIRPSILKYTPRNFCSRECSVKFKTIPISERFKKFMSQPNINGCILWTGATNGKKGYGVIQSEPPKRLLTAHRVSYTIYVGQIPDGLCVLHKCDRPLCVNPDHLFLGTLAENNADMRNKRRHSHGDRHLNARLSVVKVRDIRRKYMNGFSLDELAKMFNVSRYTIRDAVTGKTWK